MNSEDLRPWLPPASPDLVRWAWTAADAAGVSLLTQWPEVSGAGIAFGGLPVFAAWRGFQGGECLALIQPREVGALVPGARTSPLPDRWLDSLDLEALARPLATHPDFPGGASVHVVQFLGPGRLRVRSVGRPVLEFVVAVATRVTGIPTWCVDAVPPLQGRGSEP